MLLDYLPYRDIGWKDIGEEFRRYTVLHTHWFTIYLHRLKAPQPHPQCHDHPWSFLTILLRGGYDEWHDGAWTYHPPGSVLWRPAEFRHNVTTRGVSWSLVIIGPKRREWGFTEDCRAA